MCRLAFSIHYIYKTTLFFHLRAVSLLKVQEKKKKALPWSLGRSWPPQAANPLAEKGMHAALLSLQPGVYLRHF